MLTSGGGKNVVTEEAVPGGAKVRVRIDGGQKGEIWWKEKRPVVTQWLAIGKTEEGEGEVQTTKCVGMWVHGLDTRNRGEETHRK